MTTALLSHPDCLEHDVPRDHPERPGRLRAVLRALEGRDLLREEAPQASDAHLLRVHPQSYLDALAAALPGSGFAMIDGDTWLSPGSLRAARRGVGGAIRAVDMVMDGRAQNAFVATRPPGHHAERETAMGFCYFGTVAAAAYHAIEHHGLDRVGIVDFDVHHGNGTQDLVQHDARISYLSVHQMPLFPGTGAPSETGAAGQIVNAALRAGDGSAAFRDAVTARILPALDRFAPQLILVSAGFDAHGDDPLASLDLTEADFVWITEELCDLADTHAAGRLVSCLEGGYHLGALARSAAAHVDVLIARGQ
ncbi:acetoin utilization protein [Pelagivirga sediminicola]|uniref:Acetoin utilization protein n=1 Tax=Pelagivirga sediminicola TaxID=2170575 RepID=A0A2T7G7N0_9RHOB|nr:histone deacetylase family protein [Pelagivirga sediminicola]PVA10423.1 acetoin utilization protein [Pelagivirga sediminicola]